MSQAARRRRQRVRDFKRRASGFGHGNCFEQNASRGWRYVRVQPYADETDTRLHSWQEGASAPAPEGRSLDAYWEVGGDIYFVEICPSSMEATKPAGLYSRWAGDEVVSYHLMAVTDGRVITRSVFESVLEEFSRLLPKLRRTTGLSPLAALKQE